MGSESDDMGLDNAKQEVEFCVRQLFEMEPYAKSISDMKAADATKDNLIEKVFDAMESANWDNQFRDRLIKTLVAQAKYIKLLERRIGK